MKRQLGISFSLNDSITLTIKECDEVVSIKKQFYNMVKSRKSSDRSKQLTLLLYETIETIISGKYAENMDFTIKLQLINDTDIKIEKFGYIQEDS